MTVKCAYELLGFIIREYKEGNLVTLEGLEKYWTHIDKPKWEEAHSNPLAEIIIDLNLLKRDECIIVNEKDRPYEDEYIPTNYGRFSYIDMQDRFNLPEIPSII